MNQVSYSLYQDDIRMAGISTVRDKGTMRKIACELVAVDEAAASLIAGLKGAGLNAVAGKGGIIDGIRGIQDRLGKAADGKPRLTVDPSCVETINEFESYTYKEGTDKPVDAFNHSMGSLRYLQDALTEPGSFRSTEGIRVGSGGSQEFTPDFLSADDLDLGLERL